MSLFRLRQHWDTVVGAAEDFHHGSLVVGNVDNAADGAAKLVLGSLQGTLRVYLPTRPQEFRVEDLLLEETLPGAVLQLALGRFVPSLPEALALAVLQPRRLAVFLVTRVGAENRTQYLQLERQYELALGMDGRHFTAWNMISGAFGQAGHDLMCVQSMDGRLQIWEQDAHAFTRRLRDCFLPGPLLYLPATDAFVTCTAENRLEAYRYRVLAATQESDAEPGAAATSAAAAALRKGAAAFKQGTADWSVNLGETVLDLAEATQRSADGATVVTIVALGEHTLFSVSPAGRLADQLRLGYDPLSLSTYPTLAADAHSTQLLVTAADEKLYVYQAFPALTLVWAAATHHALLTTRVGAFLPTPEPLPGLIAGIDAAGHLSLNYLGTDPPEQVSASGDAKALDFAAMAEEHRELLQIIRTARGRPVTERDQLTLRAQVPLRLDAPPPGGRQRNGVTEALRPPAQVTIRFYLSWSGADAVGDVQLAIAAPPWVRLPQTSYTLEVPGRADAPLVVPLLCTCDLRGPPASLELCAVASWRSSEGEVHQATTTVELPLALACELVPPLKQSAYRLTLQSDRDPVTLNRLFDDLLAQPGLTDEALAKVAGSGGGSVLSFGYRCGDASATQLVATILVSKNSGRYRVQSASLAALWLLSAQLVSRLEAHLGASGGVELKYDDAMPLEDLFVHVDAHFGACAAVRSLRKELDAAAQQFRVIEKRLLVRFKDRNPAPLNKLDVLMTASYERLLDLGRQVQEAQDQRREAGRSLECVARLLVLLLRIRFGLDAANEAALRVHLAPAAEEGGETGWEEQVDGAITQVFRTALAKDPSKYAASGGAEEMQPLEDTQKLKKRIQILCDRLSKGARLVPETTPRRASKEASPSNSRNSDAAAEDGDSVGKAGTQEGKADEK